MNPFAGLIDRNYCTVPQKRQPPVREDYKEAQATNPWGLTQAESRLMELFANGSSGMDAAARLKIKPRSVETFVYRIRLKMKEPSRTAAILTFDRWHRE